MTDLLVFPEDGSELLARFSAPAAIAAELARAGVVFEQWPVRQLRGAPDLEALRSAYARHIAHQPHFFQSMDVVSMRPDHPDCVGVRAKFLQEHTHSDFEVRFFHAGRGTFYLHVADRVLAVTCCAGDFISIPADVRHWFDMGRSPSFVCLRLFTAPDGWVGHFTNSGIDSLFPDFDAIAAPSL